MVVLSASGTRAKSIKFGNLRFDFGAAGELAAGLLATITKIVGKDDFLIITASVLLLLRGLQKMSTITISEVEATVFWGFALGCDEKKKAELQVIRRHANQERAKVGLEKLSTNQVMNALHNLAHIKSVAQISEPNDTWQIIEQYTFK